MLKFILSFQFLFLTQVLVGTQFVAAQQTIPQQIISKYDSIRNVAPREKLYIHFDSNVYTQQDTIWFKAYLVNATLNTQSSLSALIYAELLNTNGDVIDILSLPTTLGLTWGAFALNEDKYPAGSYTFRAYTNWMKNFGNTYIFQKEIKILSTEVKLQVASNAKPGRSTTNLNRTAPSRSNGENDIQFLPEGGNWMSGVYQKMAFKAINPVGKGIEINGEIIDSKQHKITDFKSNAMGMGYFQMTPLAGEIYTAKIKTPTNVVSKNLQQSQISGTALQVDPLYSKDSVRIIITTNLPEQELTVIGQSRGVLCFVAVIKSGLGRKTIKIAKNIFSTGVAQVLIMNGKKQLLNERNFFVDFENHLKINGTTQIASYGIRDSIPISIKVTDQMGKPISGSFSIAVTDDGQVLKDSINDTHILSYLLLSSDLKGEIENPGSYFHQPNEQTKRDLDALMLTQGWVSYDWTSKSKPQFKAEKEYTISGNVTNLMNKPSVGAKVALLGKNKSFMLIDTLTNDKGEFIFDRLPYLDSASFVIQALNTKGKKGTLGITVNEFMRPPVIALSKNKIDDNAQPLDSISSKLIATKNEAYQAALKSGIVLREVKIVGKRTIKGSKNLNGPGEASQILGEKELGPIAKKTLLQVLEEKIKGFRAGNRRKSLVRDYFVNGDLARFVIDGMELDFFYTPSENMGGDDYYQFVKGYLDYYNAEDIKGVETMENGLSFRYKSRFKDPLDENTYAFIEITTKTGAGPFLKKSANLYLIRPINYGSTKVFYQPKYRSINKSDKRPDFRSTLYWNPNVVSNENGEAQFSFFSSDKKGTYTVWIEGTDTMGGIGMKTMRILIK